MSEVIQRRWLLTANVMNHPDIDRARGGRHTFVKQGFIYGENGVTVRVRVDQDTYNRALTLAQVTERGPVGLVRQNRESRVNADAARIMFAVAKTIVDKNRYSIDGFPDFVLDVYENGAHPICILEARLNRADQVVTLPSWAKEAREVTLLLDAERIANIVRYGSGPGASLDQLLTAPRPKLIAFDGPPASGKSSILKQLAEKAEALGVHVLPEAATLLMHEIGLRPDGTRHFQEVLRRFQLGLEEAALVDAARRGLRALIVDRSIMGAAPYIPKDLTYADVFGRAIEDDAKRYAAIIYIGPVPNEDIYKKVQGNNPTRRETYEEMLDLHRAGERVLQQCDGVCLKRTRSDRTGEEQFTLSRGRAIWCLSSDWATKQADAMNAVREVLERE